MNHKIKDKEYRYDVMRSSDHYSLIKKVDQAMRSHWEPLGPIVIENRGWFIFQETYYLQTMVRNDDNNNSE